MNPSTFLRVSGPEPWNVVYVEPSIRPDDSRYGENPNRLQRHTQIQVILKPEPGNPQELYLGSLRAMGVDTCANDVRFVEDNWESPVLGAWGLGWEVWLNGMEITQFTYFQQAGGRSLSVPAVEITYGLERILMSLQGVSHFKDIRYTDAISYGEMFMQNEFEMGRYNLNLADVGIQRRRFDLYNTEAKRMLEARLPIPAYDFLLKLSHVFNVMDARGAVGVTERQACFATLRALARQVTGLWLDRREELKHPLGIVAPAPPLPPLASPSSPPLQNAADFVLEIGCEELPPDDVTAALEQLRQRMPQLLDKARLQHSGVSVEGTPRRLAVLVRSLAASQPDASDRVRGPPAKVAYGSDGAGTKALEGFCRKNGVAAADVSREADEKGTEYVWATVQTAGRPAGQVLAEELPKMISGIKFRGNMRWRGDTVFSRPLRWLLALHGPQVVPFAYAGLESGSCTRMLRSEGAQPVEVSEAHDYLRLLQQNRIILEVESRAEAIWQAVSAAAATAGGEVPRSSREALLGEVTHLVESPSVILGSFDPVFLTLPREVLVMVMHKHQRYFPVYSSSHQLLPKFVTVANGAVNEDIVRAGNEDVLRARFQDAQFFFAEDSKRQLSDFRNDLSGITFQTDLGTMLDKSRRVEALIPHIATASGMAAAAADATSAAKLCHADLATATVMEMTALAGTVGRQLALASGSDAEVANAVYESVLPRNASDSTPTSAAGILVSVTDRVDSLVGLFAAGCAPTATADPFGLRRLTYGMLQTLVATQTRLDLRTAVAASAKLQPIPAEDAQEQVLTFAARRLEQLLADRGAPLETIRAVLSQRGHCPALAAATVADLQDPLAVQKLGGVLASLSRVTRIGRGSKADPEWEVQVALFKLPQETALHSVYKQAVAQLDRSGPVDGFLAAAELLVAPIDDFFDNVFVMAEDADVSSNRLALLRDVAALPDGFLTLNELPGF